ncbi:MAG TPA: thioesterase family protein [Thermoanaerobaculia bacterium]|nr:thioesterase family protein [Thermoanaerobaculia bacterium]
MSSEQRGRWRDGWFVVPHDVIFRDIDAFGHVNNAVFLTYFEIARTLLWFDVNGGRDPHDISFIVVRAECDFRKQIGMEPIEICIRFGELRATSFDTLYEIRKNGGREVAATGKVVVVLFDWARQSKIPISDDLRRRVAECNPVAS